MAPRSDPQRIIPPGGITRRTVLGAAGALALGGFATACGGPATQSSSGSASAGGKKLKDVTLVYGVPALDVTTAWFAAIPQAVGFYAQQGLNVDVQALQGGSASIGALIANRAQFATQSSQIIFTSVDRGVNLKGFMCEIPGDFIGLAVMDSSPITQESQLREALRGKTIGVAAVGGNPELEIRAVVKQLGLDPDHDVGFLAVGTGTPAINALKTGQVAALGLWAMVYANFEAQGDRLRIFQPAPLPSLGFEHATVAMQKTIDNDPAMVASFSRAIAQSLAFLSAAKPEEIVKLHYKQYPATKPQGVSSGEAVAQGVKVLNSLLPYMDLEQRMKAGQLLGDVPDSQIASVATMLTEAKSIKKALPPDSYFTRQFLNGANDFDRDAVVAQAKKFTA